MKFLLFFINCLIFFKNSSSNKKEDILQLHSDTTKIYIFKQIKKILIIIVGIFGLLILKVLIYSKSHHEDYNISLNNSRYKDSKIEKQSYNTQLINIVKAITLQKESYVNNKDLEKLKFNSKDFDIDDFKNDLNHHCKQFSSDYDNLVKECKDLENNPQIPLNNLNESKISHNFKKYLEKILKDYNIKENINHINIVNEISDKLNLNIKEQFLKYNNKIKKDSFSQETEILIYNMKNFTQKIQKISMEITDINKRKLLIIDLFQFYFFRIKLFLLFDKAILALNEIEELFKKFKYTSLNSLILFLNDNKDNFINIDIRIFLFHKYKMKLNFESK